MTDLLDVKHAEPFEGVPSRVYVLNWQKNEVLGSEALTQDLCDLCISRIMEKTGIPNDKIPK